MLAFAVGVIVGVIVGLFLVPCWLVARAKTISQTHIELYDASVDALASMMRAEARVKAARERLSDQSQRVH